MGLPTVRATRSTVVLPTPSTLYSVEDQRALRHAIEQAVMRLSPEVPVRLPFLDVTAAPYYARGDGVTNDTAAWQAAMRDASEMGGGTVWGPPGIYLVIPDTPMDDESSIYGGAVPLVAFPLYSNVHIQLDPLATIKLADAQSTDASPTPLRLFFTNTPIENVSWRGGTLDMNGDNNPISPNRGTNTYNHFTQAHILASGTIAGVAARMDGVTIDSVRFINNAGVTCIGMAQSNSASVVLGRGWKITNCTFRNNGLDTEDHSSIYAHADDVICTGNTFESDTMWGTTGSTGGRVAYEVHGADQIFAHNTIKNYYQMAWVSTNFTSTITGIVIADNTAYVRGIGVDFDRSQGVGAVSTDSEIDGVLIDNNSVTFDNLTIAASLKVGVQIPPLYAASNITVSNNTVRATGTAHGVRLCAVAAQDKAGNELTNIVMRGNTGYGMSYGISVQTSATNGMGNVTIDSNTFFDNATIPGIFDDPIGIFIDASLNPIASLTETNNKVIYSAASAHTKYGSYIGGQITNNYRSGNSYVGCDADYFENSLSVTSRVGTFEGIAYVPTLTGVTAVGNGTLTASYSLNGNVVTVNASLQVGSTTIFGGGTIAFSTPFPSRTVGAVYLGGYRIFDVSASLFATGISEIDGTASTITMEVDGGTNADATTPVTLATGDVVSVQITYLRA